ncbi:MAG: endonuclease III, partial [Myxococcales bacterium]|nr:endonuclease III [Myxococcales bacterium]
KTERIQGTAKRVLEVFGGEVPNTMQDLLTLPGVARKTANVVLGTVFRIPTGMVVDTHAKRVSNRLEITSESKPELVERDLCKVFPEDQWIDMSHRLVLHGRYVCLARNPKCTLCPLAEICPSAEAGPVDDWEPLAHRELLVVESRGAVKL